LRFSITYGCTSQPRETVEHQEEALNLSIFYSNDNFIVSLRFVALASIFFLCQLIGSPAKHKTQIISVERWMSVWQQQQQKKATELTIFRTTVENN
jgi:hypothetical protein